MLSTIRLFLPLYTNKLIVCHFVSADMVYWSRDSEPKEEPTSPWGYYRAPSAEVEMTSYALLAYTVGNQPEAVINSKPIVMWLSKQRNAQGGFSSTQVPGTTEGLSLSYFLCFIEHSDKTTQIIS